MKTTAENIIFLGKYEQDNNLSNSKEPIAWHVLAVENGKALLFADKILDSKSYHNIEFEDVTWETCTLRAWLNNEFYNAAFSATEKAEIITTRTINEGNPNYVAEGGNDTDDKVFLLSYSEVTNPAYGFSPEETTVDAARCAQCTEFAKSNGLWVSDNVSYFGNGHWWSRSTGVLESDACLVRYDGYITSSSVCTTGIGVRPAIWIKIDTADGSEEIAITYESGSIYKGASQNDERHGFGRMTYMDNGEVVGEYIGYWSNDVKHGEGTFTAKDGTKSIGEFMNNEFHGNGTVIFPDGSKHTGEWSNGLFHGYGKMFSMDGKEYVGEWSNGLPHGQGKMTYVDGSCENGEWENGEFIG